jgi:hypothetical protein
MFLSLTVELQILGTVGLSAGAFLVSPYSLDGVPDIQLTAYPKVRVVCCVLYDQLNNSAVRFTQGFITSHHCGLRLCPHSSICNPYPGSSVGDRAPPDL